MCGRGPLVTDELDDESMDDPRVARGRRRRDTNRRGREVRKLLKNYPTAEAIAEAKAYLTDRPDHADIWRLLGMAYTELGDDVGAVMALKKAARLDPEGNAPVALLYLLMQRARFSVSARLADYLEKAGAGGNRFYSLLARIALIRGQADRVLAIIAKAETEKEDGEVSPYVETMRKTALAMKAEIEAGNTMEQTRHIAICGVSHVGSTMLGIILEGADNVAFAGETHSLTEVKMHRWGGRGRVPVARDIPVEKWPWACRVCGQRCEIFDPEFRLWLVDNPTGKYAHIAKRLGVQTIVTADKNVDIYWERDPLFRFDQIVLYKSPQAQLRSTLKIDLKANPDAAKGFHRQVPELLSRWTTIYYEHLYLIRPTGKQIVIDWEALVADPERHFERLSSRLGINLTMSALTSPRFGHFIGGNTGVNVRELQKAGRIELRPSNAPPLPEDAKAAAEAHLAAQRVHRMLDRRYKEVFG